MINITLLDDHHLVREGVKSLIETNPDYRITDEYNCAESLLQNCNLTEAEVLITDISLPGMSGIELSKEIRKTSTAPKIIVLSMYDDQWHIKEAFNAGVDGYLLKDCSKEELFRAIESVCAGEKYFSNNAMKSISNSLVNEKTYSEEQPMLSEREIEIIKLLADGVNSEAIAKQLGLSSKTVSNHRANIMIKLNVKNSCELMAKAVKAKII